ncbi:hypothetical protein B0H19DRAFT_1263297 [Mycena capillaripes]|nr:hypothetical protein B0H19DRAFT_1263297 [Mycena capillaripes]
MANMDFNFTSQSTFGHPHASVNGTGMFSSAHNFTVTATNLTNITQNFTLMSSNYNQSGTDFRVFPLGDIDLQCKLSLDVWIVTRQLERQRIRPIYNAKVRGESTTASIYQGHGAEQEWREEIAKYMSIRHPNILQVCGVASTGNIHATLFHGGLMPVLRFVDLHKHSHFLTVYIYFYCRMKFEEVKEYFDSAFKHNLSPGQCTYWIRSSTSQFCVDLQPSGGSPSLYGLAVESRMGIKDPSSVSSLEAATIIGSLTLKQYHDLCYRCPGNFRNFTISTRTTVGLGAIYFCPSRDRFEDAVIIAFLPLHNKVDVHRWYETPRQAVVVGGWTRLDANDAWDSTLRLDCLNSYPDVRRYWTSAANHIFSRLQITSNFQDYAIVDQVTFQLKISKTSKTPPHGYLFLCPKEDFRAGPSSVSWLHCLAYWSLDPWGVDRLSAEEAAELGFPPIQLTAEIYMYCWDESVYTGVRQFHRAKGFNPDSQDVAQHLGHKLFQLSSEVDPLSALVEEVRDSDEAEFAMDVDVDEVDAESAEEGGVWDRMVLTGGDPVLGLK